MEKQMYDDILQRLERIEKTQNHDKKKIDQIYYSLIGDKLERRIGLLDQVDENTKQIEAHSERLVTLNDKIERTSKPIGKILTGTAAGLTGGGVLGAKWQVIVQKLIAIFGS